MNTQLCRILIVILKSAVSLNSQGVNGVSNAIFLFLDEMKTGVSYHVRISANTFVVYFEYKTFAVKNYKLFKIWYFKYLNKTEGIWVVETCGKFPLGTYPDNLYQFQTEMNSQILRYTMSQICNVVWIFKFIVENFDTKSMNIYTCTWICTWVFEFLI